MSAISGKQQVTVVLLAAACLAAGAARAQTAAPAIETITVTSTHLPAAVGQGAFSTTELTQGDLASFDQLDAGLEQVPGLAGYRRNTSLSANPSVEGVSLRAIAPSAASRAVVMLDGVPVNDPFGGWVIWNALPAEDIGGANIIRGAGTGPYGDGALTGTILLSEREDLDGLSQAGAEGGDLDTFRAGASGGTTLGPVALFASGAAEHSNGWIPVAPAVRGPADNSLRMNSGAASLRAQTSLGEDITATARLGYYSELQDAGLVGAGATADGETASLSIARDANSDHLGWRVQAWTIASGFTNRSVSTAFGQTATTPADDQYATPALGWGTNVAALGIMGALRWELGADLRDDQGQSKEFYNYSSTLDVFQDARRSGGQSIVAGLYGEGAYDLGPWLFTLGARGDNWSTSQGHLLQTVVSGGALIADKTYAARSDTVPTGRAGVRRDFDDGEYLRVSAYEGFRAPTLNELYRPFRVGNVVTEANPALNPEKLGGVDVGWGGTLGTFSWDATGFWNDLHDAVDNVTVPLTVCPPFPPNTPGAACQMKQNIANIDAVGLEGDVAERLSDALSLRAAVSWTDARLRPGAADPLADGKRPAEAPPATITAGADWSPLTPLTLSAQLRWVAREYQDDLNTISLGSALTVDIGAAWQLRDHLSVFGRIENLANATVATAYTTGVYNVAAPRTFEFGVTYAN